MSALAKQRIESNHSMPISASRPALSINHQEELTKICAMLTNLAPWSEVHEAPSDDLGLASERPLELIQVVQVVPGHERDEVADGEAPAGRVHAPTLPAGGRQPPQVRERLLAPAAEVAQGLRRVVL